MVREAGGRREAGVECELCRTAIGVELEVSWRCNSCAETKWNVCDKWLLFIVCLLGVIFSTSLLVYSGLQLRMEISNGYGSAQTAERIVVISSLVLNFVLLVFFSYNLGSYFLQKKAKVKLVSK